MHERPRPTLVLTILLAALSLVAGCGGDDGDRGATDTRPSRPSFPTTASTASTAAPAQTTPAAPVCGDGTSAGRRYLLCIAGDAEDQGLVIAVHGRGSSADDMRAATGLEHPAAAAGLAVVYPEALDGGWGDDTFTGPGRPTGDEDVAFLDALVSDLRADPRIGDRPVGVVGFSNGASMALRYAAERPDDVAAVVAVAGQVPRDPAVRPAARVPLLLVYGTADPVRPFATGIPEPAGRAPGEPTPTLPTADSVAAFVAGAGGAPTHEGPTASDPDPGDGTNLETERWSDGGGTIAVLRTVVGGGHTWPSARVAPRADYGPVSRDLDASAEAVAFVVDPAGFR
jgi:polyhydroxybutyrate depolymerase